MKEVIPMAELYLIIDTETANDIDCPLCYDISFAVIDKNGRIYTKYSFVVQEIFRHERDLMTSCYFADKLPQYEADIENGTRLLRSIYDIREVLHKVAKNFNVRAIMAHNALFDYRALNNTIRYITKSKTRYFLPYNLEIWDTLKMARQTFGTSAEYKKFCDEHSFLNKFNRPQLTAEVLYRYITNNVDFIEAHTGDEDIKIEKVIFSECLKANPDIEKRLFKTKEEKERIEKEKAEKKKRRKKVLTKPKE